MWKFIHLIACSSCMVTGQSLNIATVEPQHIPTIPEPNMINMLRPLRMLLLALSPVARDVHNSESLRFSSPRLSDGPDPEDWRAFRANLVNGEFNVEDSEDNAVSEEKPKENKIRRVAPANEALLKKQNKDLWKEYLEGAWAHEIGAPEVGGLICHLSYPAQIIRMMQDDPGGSELGKLLFDRLLADLSPEANTSSSKEVMASWSSTSLSRAYMYRAAETLVKEMGESLLSVARPSPKGMAVVDLGSLSPGVQEFVKLSYSSQEIYQNVALVLSVDADRDEVESVVLNRPLRFNINTELAEILLNGVRDGLPRQYDGAFVDRFLTAFEGGAVYVGGPKNQDMPATLIHGFDLPSATEIAPGTRIFKGGVDAAVNAVLSGERSPLDFRWFLGSRLDTSPRSTEWSSIACARPIALKQCIQLPKPLWHEVLELCSGVLAEMSQRELTYRLDLTSEESSSDEGKSDDVDSA